LSGDDEWATRLVATRHAITERTGATVVGGLVGDLRDQTEHEVRDRLGPERWARAYAAGRTCAIDSVLNDIDHFLKQRSRDV